MALNISGKTAVTFLNRAFHNTAPGNELFNYQVAEAGSTDESQLAFAARFVQSSAGLTNAAFADLILTNMGVLPSTVASVQAFQTELAAYLDGVIVSDRGIVVLQLADILADLQDLTGELAVYAAAATAWDREVAVSLAYSDNAINHTTTDPVDTLDEVAPHLLGVAAGNTSVSVNFDETLQEVASAVLAPLFTVTVTNAAGVVSNYPVDRATVIGSSVTLALTQSLAGQNDIKVSYAGNVLKDAAGNAVAAIDKAVASTDTTAPTWTLTDPADNTVGVAANANLTLTFVDTDLDNNDATVPGVKLGTGNVIIKSADGTDTHTIAVTDASQVTFSATNKTLVINPTASLKAGVAYTVTLDAGAVRDLAGNGNTVGGDLAQNFTVTINKADTVTVELPAAGATKTVPLVNDDVAAPITAAKNTGADTVVLATKPVAGSTINITHFTLGTGPDADTLKLGGYTGVTALAQDITKITVAESTSLFATDAAFSGRDLNSDGDFVDANEIAPKQFLNFEVTVNGAIIKLDDLIALDALAASVKAMLPAADFVDGTGDGANSIDFTSASDIATLVGSFGDNIAFGA